LIAVQEKKRKVAAKIQGGKIKILGEETQHRRKNSRVKGVVGEASKRANKDTSWGIHRLDVASPGKGARETAGACRCEGDGNNGKERRESQENEIRGWCEAEPVKAPVKISEKLRFNESVGAPRIPVKEEKLDYLQGAKRDRSRETNLHLGKPVQLSPSIKKPEGGG